MLPRRGAFRTGRLVPLDRTLLQATSTASAVSSLITDASQNGQLLRACSLTTAHAYRPRRPRRRRPASHRRPAYCPRH
jgi:hypothetical protein